MIVLSCGLTVNGRPGGSVKECLLGPPNHFGDRAWTIPAKLARTRQCLRCGLVSACGSAARRRRIGFRRILPSSASNNDG